MTPGEEGERREEGREGGKRTSEVIGGGKAGGVLMEVRNKESVTGSAGRGIKL